jgi:hypothetical protein
MIEEVGRGNGAWIEQRQRAVTPERVRALLETEVIRVVCRVCMVV